MDNNILLDNFFASGGSSCFSPFLNRQGRLIAKKLELLVSLGAFILLLTSLGLSYVSPPLSAITLALVYLCVGPPALIHTIKKLSKLDLGIDILMTLAAFFSLPMGRGFEGGLLLTLFEISSALESVVSEKTKSTILSLHKLSPPLATVVIGEEHHPKPLHKIQIGETLYIKAGEIIPLDGTVQSGHSFVNLVHLTGESVPIPKHPGDLVPAGAANLEGVLQITVTRLSQDSTLAHIINLIHQAQEAKPKAERLFQTFGQYYVTTVLCLTAFVALSFPWLFNLPVWGDNGSIYRSLAFLITASPCALVIAMPTAYLSAISSCARRGVLLKKGGAILDSLATINVVAFDKTGTLTTGKLTYSSSQKLWGSLSEERALSIVAGLERGSSHPIAEAISRYAKQKKINLTSIQNFQSIPGYGVQGIDSSTNNMAYVGNPEFILPLATREAQLCYKKQNIQKIHALLWAEESLFSFSFIDEIRDESKKTITDLQEKYNLSIILLTGDHSESTNYVTKALSIDETYTGLKPEDKLHYVSLFSQKRGLVMVGDGVNDAPALTRATVGIAMGKIGSATAIDASDIIFLHDEIGHLPWLLCKAHQTRRVVTQNIILALGVILLATTPALLGHLPLWLAVILHEGGTVLVGLNSLRLLR